MQKVKTFLLICRNSLLPQPPFYLQVRRHHFLFSLKYFISLIFITQLVFFILTLFLHNSLFNSLSFYSSLSKSLKAYPQDLVAIVKNGYLMTNAGRPYVMWMEKPGGIVPFIVIDETARPEEINDYHSKILLTGKDIVINKGSMKYSTHSLPPVSLTINKKTAQFLGLFFNVLATIGFIIIPLVSLTLLPLVHLIGSLIFLGLVSLVVYIFFHYRIHRLTLAKTYQISLHAFTLPFLTKYLLLLFFPTSTITFPLFFFLTLIFVGGAIYEAYFLDSSRHKI